MVCLQRVIHLEEIWQNIMLMACAIVFGMDFDPVTGKLWDTENGPWHGEKLILLSLDLIADGKKFKVILENAI